MVSELVVLLLLEDERVIKNGYYAYVLEKCLPAIVHFGYDNKADEYEKIIKEIYEGNWISKRVF